jgi:hypothetical protein
MPVNGQNPEVSDAKKDESGSTAGQQNKKARLILKETGYIFTVLC